MRKSKLSGYKQSRLIELFIAVSTPRTAARLVGVPKEHFHLFLKECDWRFNHSDLKFQ